MGCYGLILDIYLNMVNKIPAGGLEMCVPNITCAVTENSENWVIDLQSKSVFFLFFVDSPQVILHATN